MRLTRSLLLLLLFFVSAPLLAQEPAEDADRTHLRVDYLYWYLRRLNVPPLLTAGPAGSSGVLGDEDTVVLRGGRLESRHDRYIGVRARADRWLDDEHSIGLQADAFFLERDSTHFTVHAGDVPVLAIPFSDAGRPGSFVVSGFNPEFGDLLGGTRVYSRMELFGQEGNVMLNLGRSAEIEWNLLAGTRFLQLRERLDLTSSARVLPEQSTLIGLEDHIQTFNKFYGGQFGVEGTWRRGRWSIEGKAAFALGADEQLVRNKGTRIVHTPQQRLEEPVGLFVQAGNRGAFERVSFDVVTELRVNVGFELTRALRLKGGYSFLTWDGPVRPGEQVVEVGRTRFQEELFWAHGANAGLEVCW